MPVEDFVEKIELVQQEETYFSSSIKFNNIVFFAFSVSEICNTKKVFSQMNSPKLRIVDKDCYKTYKTGICGEKGQISVYGKSDAKNRIAYFFVKCTFTS